jgi:hypothetical protein
VRALRIRGRILIAGCFLVTAAVYCTILLRSRTPPSPRAVASAQDEVYETVVRDMVASMHRRADINHLVFDDTVLNELSTGADLQSCEERVRTDLRLESNALSDRLYRLLTRSGYDSLRADTIHNFLEKACTTGPLSQTFRTDLPRTVVAAGSLRFDGGSKSFQELFPRATGIISFSYVGFDSTLSEAIVSSAHFCGGLCGTGSRYVLRKQWGRWEVVNKRVVWVP